jgi:hypothetical protein
MGNVSLKIVLLYSDRGGRQLGREVAETLRHKLGRSFHARQSNWNVELLRSRKLRALAAAEARESDIIIVALTEGVPLSPEVRNWFNLWRGRKRTVPSALVALLKREDAAAPPIVQETLHRFAKAARMDFFCHSELRREYPRFRVAARGPVIDAAIH